MLKYECKDKLDRIYPFLIFLFLLIFVIFYHCMFLGREETMYLQGFLLVQKSALILFVGMLFISFEFFAEYQKKNWRELLAVYRGGLRKSMCGKFFCCL